VLVLDLQCVQAAPEHQPGDYGPWLSRDTAPARLGQLLAPCLDAILSTHPVSKAVGNVRNEGAQLIAPEPVPQPR